MSSFSNDISSHKYLIAHQAGCVTDWNGSFLSKKVFDHLSVGDIVRVQIEATEEATTKAKEKAEAEAEACNLDGEGENSEEIKLNLSYSKYYGGISAPYFEIVKIKDGTFWGKAQDTYGTLSMFGVLKEGNIFPFRKENIIEIPIDWIQNKKRRNIMKQYIQEKGRSVTGIQ